MASRSKARAALAALRDDLTGDVLAPEDVGYDAARAVFNAMIDRRPAVIARCAGAADVVLVNLQSPLEDMARLIARLRQQGQAAVILSASETQTELFFFIEAGASGYVSRRSGEAELLAAVRAVASGDIYFSTRLRDQSLREQRTRITHRERQILQLIANGATDREIAAKLNISEHTVHTHLDRLRGKTGCHRRADLVRLALLRDGAGEPPD